MMILVDKAYNMLNKIEIYPRTDVRWNFNKRFTTTLGRHSRCKDDHLIQLNYRLFRASYDDNPNFMLEIIIHELLHTLDGCQNHQKLWKSYMDKVNLEYGLNLARTITMPDEYWYHIYDMVLIVCDNGCIDEFIPKHHHICKNLHQYKCSSCGCSLNRTITLLKSKI